MNDIMPTCPVRNHPWENYYEMIIIVLNKFNWSLKVKALHKSRCGICSWSLLSVPLQVPPFTTWLVNTFPFQYYLWGVCMDQMLSWTEPGLWFVNCGSCHPIGMDVPHSPQVDWGGLCGLSWQTCWHCAELCGESGMTCKCTFKCLLSSLLEAATVPLWLSERAQKFKCLLTSLTSCATAGPPTSTSLEVDEPSTWMSLAYLMCKSHLKGTQAVPLHEPHKHDLVP